MGPRRGGKPPAEECDVTECPPTTEPDPAVWSYSSQAEIRVLVAYTPEAWTDAQGTGQDPLALAASYMELGNLIYSNSAVSHRFVLADAVPISIHETPPTPGDTSIETEAAAICGLANEAICVAKFWMPTQFADPASELSQLRHTAAADVVLLLGIGFGSGAAYGVPDEPAIDPHLNAGIAIDYNRTSDVDIVHELSHLLGAGHNLYQLQKLADYVEPAGPGIDYGYTQPDLQAYTVMAYDDECVEVHNGTDCTQVPWLSSPEVFIDGQILSGTTPSPSDKTSFNACVVEHYGSQVANYYEMRDNLEPVLYAPSITECPTTYLLSHTYDVGGDWCVGDFLITNDTNLQNWITNCGTIVGNVEISGVSDLTPLQSVAVVKGDLSIHHAPLLQTLNGLQSLTIVEGELTLNDLDIDAVGYLGNLRQVGKLTLSNLHEPTVTNLAGLENLTIIDDLSIINNSNLTSLFGLYGVTAVPGSVIISNSMRLETLDGFENLMYAGSVEVSDNDALWTIEALGDLQSLNELTVENNTSLTNCNLPGVDPAVVTINDANNGSGCTFPPAP